MLPFTDRVWDNDGAMNNKRGFAQLVSALVFTSYCMILVGLTVGEVRGEGHLVRHAHRDY